jgi:putative ABC transport system permease protein
VRLLGISLRNVRIRFVSSALTTVAIVVATGLYAAILLMVDQTDQRYRASLEGYRSVIGPKGSSELELVLNTVFNVGTARELIRLKVYEELRDPRKLGRRTQLLYAIPQARGDVFSKYQFAVVGTTDEMWSKFQRGEHPLEFADGGPWQFSSDELMAVAAGLAAHVSAKRTGETPVPPRPRLPPEWRQAVLGSRVARQLGLGLGGEVVPSHGKPEEFGFHEHREASCRVVGVLAPTNSPIDSTIFIPLGTYALLADHEDGVFVVDVPPGKNPDDAKHLPVKAEDLGLTAIIAYPKDHLGGKLLRDELASRPGAQGAWPQDVIPRFLRQVGSAADAMAVVAWLVLFVAGISTSVSIYNTMNERRREIAIMRSLGARRSQIAAIIVGEAAMLAGVGALLGVLACHLVALAMRGMVEDRTGVWLDWTAFAPRELILVAAVTLLGAVAGLLPAIKGSLTQVADNLTPNS